MGMMLSAASQGGRAAAQGVRRRRRASELEGRGDGIAPCTLRLGANPNPKGRTEATSALCSTATKSLRRHRRPYFVIHDNDETLRGGAVVREVIICCNPHCNCFILIGLVSRTGQPSGKGAWHQKETADFQNVNVMLGCAEVHTIAFLEGVNGLWPQLMCCALLEFGALFELTVSRTKGSEESESPKYQESKSRDESNDKSDSEELEDELGGSDGESLETKSII
ncbi:hypothetical protein K474DRAFT_1680692 [Panus rudis PR-1116 ss-1]|nr:hypothetical protein K474DRAFT_1680692 [Panus rudis PR-1116 ss-1]